MEHSNQCKVRTPDMEMLLPPSSTRDSPLEVGSLLVLLDALPMLVELASRVRAVHDLPTPVPSVDPCRFLPLLVFELSGLAYLLVAFLSAALLQNIAHDDAPLGITSTCLLITDAAAIFTFLGPDLALVLTQ